MIQLYYSKDHMKGLTIADLTTEISQLRKEDPEVEICIAPLDKKDDDSTIKDFCNLVGVKFEEKIPKNLVEFTCQGSHHISLGFSSKEVRDEFVRQIPKDNFVYYHGNEVMKLWNMFTGVEGGHFSV